MAVQWNEDQLKVIHHRDGSLLVSAAAGSGKTAVMIERLIRMITDPKDPVDVEELLVVTFTNAAASQMREKLSLALEEQLLQEQEESRQQRLMVQLQKLKNAEVETLHSFCLQCVRDYITRIPDLDPGFRIADETEARLLMTDTLEEILENAYLRADTNPESEETRYFRALLDSYSGTRQDLQLEDLVLRIHAFLESLPEPEAWLDQAVESYQLTEEELISSPWYKVMQEEIGANRRLALDRYRTVRSLFLAQGADGSSKVMQALDRVVEALEQGEERRDILIDRMDYSPFKTDPEAKERVKAVYEIAKEAASKALGLEKEWLGEGASQQAELCRERVYPALKGLRNLLLDFRRAYQKAKADRSLVDFPDLEHYALMVLMDSHQAPSAAALEIRDRFRYICVDEYQDSNEVQEAILRAVSRKNDEGEPVNLFMVGDVKQSIYKFREARPELFMEKMDRFPTQKDADLIRLHQNFRSRAAILEAVNDLFFRWMHRPEAEIEYGAEEALVPGRVFPEEEDPRILQGEPEFYLLTSEEPLRTTDAFEAEADFIARKIQTLVLGGARIYDPDQGYRPLRYQDIVILLRSTKNQAPALQEALRRYLVPSFSEVTSGFYQTKEIQCIVNLLKVIDNPLQDIPLAGVLYSPIFHFTGHELARIRRQKGQKESLMDSLVRFSTAEDLSEADKRIAGRVRVFLEVLDSFRERSHYLAVPALIWEILEETGYYVYIAGTPEGNIRKANLDLLLRYAEAFEAGSYSGLFHFLRYIEKMEEQERDEVQARILGEEENVVRIMTIHKSKGLEFPVVFVSSLGKNLNQQDIKDRILLNPSLGIGADAVDPSLDFRFDTLARQAVKTRKKQEFLAEELRILYVALTRAQQKLYLTGYSKKEDKPRITGFAQATSYLDWIWPVAETSDKFLYRTETVSLPEAEAAEAAVDPAEEAQADREMYEEIDRRLAWKYPQAWRGLLPSRLSVSQLKKSGEEEEIFQMPPLIHEAEEETEEIPYEPGGSDAGTAVHKVLSLLDLKSLRDKESILRQLDQLEAAGLLTSQERLLVPVRQLELFAVSPLLERMNRSAKLLKEQPFIVKIPIHKIREWIPDWMDTLPEEAAEQSIMVQGIIDGCFMEDGQWVILDYKTDRVLDEPRVRMYRRQLELYRYALNQITGIPVGEILLYWTRTGEEVVL